MDLTVAKIKRTIAILDTKLAPLSGISFDQKDTAAQAIQIINSWRGICNAALLASGNYRLNRQAYLWFKDRHLLNAAFMKAVITEDREQKKQLLQAVKSRLPRMVKATNDKEDCSALEWICIQNGITPLENMNIYCEKRLKEITGS